MKLELKNLAGYLPYGLKMQLLGYPFEKKIGIHVRTLELDCGHDFHFYLQDNKVRPILRPLSDLTKDENFELYMDLCDELGLVRCEHLLLALQDNLKYAFNLQDLNILEEWMYKNHFDWKYNLIENGLAIDINTL